MKNQFKTIAAALLIMTAFSLKSDAQESSSNGVRYSVGADLGLPIGKLADHYKWSIGGSIQADIPVSKKLYVTINSGYTNIFSKRDVATIVPDIHLIPIKAGLKYFAIDDLYVQGEVGASIILNRENIFEKKAVFVYAPQIGYLIPVGKKEYLDAGVRFERNDRFFDHGKNHDYLGLRLAYAFPIGK